ncbi:unnamed protein product [Adineta ricciae]|uniref:Uncharacterized protein n=1 Tax=Adineta ricciae TaxID=249248 RepID=A0A816ABN2_ADIRI|nr:unnamed protein product [Adineta ricciae]CAF1593519.1 unnamed protein product [Adineta ricciae]
MMIDIFKAIARPVMTYGYPVILTANDKVWDRLQIIQNKALRATLGLPIYTSVEYIHRITKIPKVKAYATSLLQQSIAEVLMGWDNPIPSHLVPSHFIPSHFIPWDIFE